MRKPHPHLQLIVDNSGKLKTELSLIGVFERIGLGMKGDDFVYRDLPKAPEPDDPYPSFLFD